MVSIAPTDVREAGDLDAADYPDADIQFETDLAESVVTDELQPHTDNTSRLEQTAALLGAAYVVEDTVPERVGQESGSVSFDLEESLTLFTQAKQADPTGRLGGQDQTQARFEVF